MSPALMGPSGAFTVRYVINPVTGGYAILPNVPLEQPISIDRVKNFERLLGVKTRFTS